MNSSDNNSGPELIQAVYLEEAARDYPLAQLMLRRYAGRPVIPVRHYKDVFNRPNQSFRLQKQHMSLILAVKEKPFLYPGPEVCQNFGADRFFYMSLALNCPFDCEYCFLQGLYPSANLVVFVNTDDFQQAVAAEASRNPIFLAASYDTDLIALHSIIPCLDEWRSFLAGQQDLTMEIRTKSANQLFFRQYEPLSSLIIAFSLSPELIRQRFEMRTPSLEARLKTVQFALERGFKVRLCFDPVLIHPDWDEIYEPFFHQVFHSIDPRRLVDISYGYFRMSAGHFARIAKQRPDSFLFAQNYLDRNDVVSYPLEEQEAVCTRHMALLSSYLPKERIFIR
ncbi:MAG: DNA photolyase [Clostridiaceae bacterium]|nr:DNA photolyase [Clostridiaceae bacterium]